MFHVTSCSSDRTFDMQITILARIIVKKLILLGWYTESHLQLHLKPRITAVYSCVVIDTQNLIGIEFRLPSSFLVMLKMTSLLWLVVNQQLPDIPEVEMIFNFSTIPA